MYLNEVDTPLPPLWTIRLVVACELLRVELESTEAVIAEAGKMIYTRGVVEWNVVLPG